MADSHQLTVEGMNCTNCAASVERFLERKGMEDIYVDFATGEVRFHSDNGADLPNLKAGINKLGYRVIEENTPEPWWTIEKKLIVSAIFTLPLLLQHIFMVAGWPFPAWLADPWAQLILCLPPFVIGAQHFGGSALRSLRGGVPNMDVLIFLGSTAAFIYSLAGLYLQEPNYIFFETAATIITLVLVGNWLEHRSVQQTTVAIEELTRLQAQKARKLMPSGQVVQLDLEEVQKGDVLLVNEGDRVPADGIIREGDAVLDESIVTGESLPAEKGEGEEVIGGSLLSKGSMKLEVTATGSEALLGRMIELVKAAQQDKPRLQRLADRISNIFVPLVVGIALLTLLLSTLVFGLPFQQALMNSIAVLVISCPCALGLATPTAVTVGVGKLARAGILIKGASTLETLAAIKRYAFDKTGTLTSGEFRIRRVNYEKGSPEELRKLMLELEQRSSHPIAHSLVAALSGEAVANGEPLLLEVEELKGLGMRGRDREGREYRLGSWRTASAVTRDQSHDLYLSTDQELLATVDIEDDLRAGARETMDYLHRQGKETVLLSGDKEEKVRRAAADLGIDRYFAAQQPQEKLERIAALSREEPTAMVGDGINDSPALARATLGISLSTGSQAAIQSAQLVLLNGKISQLPRALGISKTTLVTIKQNLFWAFAYNIVAIPMAAMGYLNPMWAALFMAFSDLVVVGNSLRLRWRKV